MNYINILIILLPILLFLYIIYNRRINNFILLNSDIIIIFIIISLIYKYINDNKNIIEYFLPLIIFLIGLIQYRVAKEQEIINKYYENKEKSGTIDNFINNYKLLGNIIKYNNNFEIIIMNEVFEVINSEEFEKFKNGIKDRILNINGIIGNPEYFIVILEKMIKKQVSIKNKLKRKEDEKKIDINIKRIKYIKDIFKETNHKLFKELTITEKIKLFLTP